ncbi:MAG TPA: antibiotic biosynthesis monooxygenase [Candidatus Acidoferrum sp.]|nr:antibiotic biosynthesis monooxygenase [Candidatus Acidoferrum sp.]
MDRVGIWVVMESKAGKEDEVEAFLKSARALAEKEEQTTSWYAVRIGPSKYGIFDTFPDERGRVAHLTGEIAKALAAKAPELFAHGPEIHRLSILESKTPNPAMVAAGDGN